MYNINIILTPKKTFLKKNKNFIDITINNSTDLFNGNKVQFYFSVLENLICASDGIKNKHL